MKIRETVDAFRSFVVIATANFVKSLWSPINIEILSVFVISLSPLTRYFPLNTVYFSRLPTLVVHTQFSCLSGAYQILKTFFLKSGTYANTLVPRKLYSSFISCSRDSFFNTEITQFCTTISWIFIPHIKWSIYGILTLFVDVNNNNNKIIHTIPSIWYVHRVVANKFGSDSARNAQISEGNVGKSSPVQV